MELLLALGALAGLFWVGVVLLRGGLLGGALLVLLAGSCLGSPFLSVPTGAIPLTLDRVLLLVVLVQYYFYRRWGWTDPKPLAKGDYLLAAFLLVLAASTFTHDFMVEKSQPVSQLLFFYMMPAAMYWLARQMPLSERAAWWTFGTLAAFGLYLSVTAVAETHQVWAVVFPSYVGSPESREFFGRGRGPFLNPAANGMMQSLGLCAALMWWPRVNRHGKLVLLALSVVFLYGVYSTLTRSAWMGLGLSLFVVVGCAMPRQWRLPVAGSMTIALVVLLALTWQNFAAFKRDKDLSAEEALESARLRPILAAVAWSMFQDRPLLGCGYGNYLMQSRPYLNDATFDLPLQKVRPFVQHNVLLSLLTETGLLGMGLFVAVLATWTRNAWRLWNSSTVARPLAQLGLLFIAFLGAYLANGMFQDVALIPMVNMTLFFLAGMVTGLASTGTATSDERLRLWLGEGEPALAAH